jgi:hypothetical protein
MEKKKKTITAVEFSRESGIQVAYPSGTFLKRIVMEDKPTQGLRQFENTYSKLNIKDVQMNTAFLVVTFKDGSEKHFPLGQISHVTVEEI